MAIPEGTFDQLTETSRDFMRDTLTVWAVTEDTSTPDAYDTTETQIYGPSTTPHEGTCSITEDLTRFDRATSGDETLDADAMATLPLVDASLEKKMIDKECTAEYRGQTRRGRITSTVRRQVTAQLLIEWL